MCLVGAAIAIGTLGAGAAAGVAAPKHRAGQKARLTVKATCKTEVAVMVAAGDSSVTPPVEAGQEYGSANCGKPMGDGVQRDQFDVTSGGDTESTVHVVFPDRDTARYLPADATGGNPELPER